MTLPEELVKAAANAPCLRYPEDFKCGEGHNLSDSDDRQHPECVLAAVLRALPECEAIEEAVRSTVYDGNMELAHRIAQRVLATIAKLADEEAS